MSAQVNSQPNGVAHSGNEQDVCLPTCFHRVASIPVVADTLGAVQATIQSHAYLSAMFGKAGGVVAYLYEQSKPFQPLLSGPLHQVDAVANKGLDFVQEKAPFVFEIKAEDLISKARLPADQAFAYGKTYKEAASARIAPMVEQFHTQLTRSQQTLSSLQEKLQCGLQSVRKDPTAVPDQIKHLSEQLVGELGRISQFAAEKSHDLPQQAQQAVGPLVEKLQKAYNDIKEEMVKVEVPLSQRATHVMNYSRDQVLPIVQEAVLTVKKLIGNNQSP